MTTHPRPAVGDRARAGRRHRLHLAQEHVEGQDGITGPWLNSGRAQASARPARPNQNSGSAATMAKASQRRPASPVAGGLPGGAGRGGG